MMRYLAEDPLESVSESLLAAADVNHDGIVNLSDLYFLMRQIFKL